MSWPHFSDEGTIGQVGLFPPELLKAVHNGEQSTKWVFQKGKKIISLKKYVENQPTWQALNVTLLFNPQLTTSIHRRQEVLMNPLLYACQVQIPLPPFKNFQKSRCISPNTPLFPCSLLFHTRSRFIQPASSLLPMQNGLHFFILAF